MRAFFAAGTSPAGRVSRSPLVLGVLVAAIAAGCQAGAPTTRASAVHAKASVVDAPGAPEPGRLAVSRADSSDTSSRVITAMEIAQTPVTSAQVAAALAAAAQASQAVLDANAVLKEAQEAQTKAAADASKAADALNKANQAVADAQMKLAAATAAADQAALSGNVAEQAISASTLATAKADAATAAAAQAAAQASAAASESALAQAQSQAAVAAAAQAVARANESAAQSALAQAQSQSAATLAAEAKFQSQSAADAAALALARANSDSAQLANASANAWEAASAAAQALATANDVAAKLAPTPTPIPAPIIRVSTYSGAVKGMQNGLAAIAQFDHPNGLAFDLSGSLIVADAGNNQIRRISLDGTVTTVAGSSPGYFDANGTSARFSNPYGVAVGPDGSIFVADTYNHCIRKILSDGSVSTIAGNGVKGFSDGAGATARFNLPFSLDVDPAGNVYVADTGNNRIRQVTPDGNVTTLAGSGASGKADGTRQVAQFSLPGDVLVDRTGTLWVADLGNNEIRGITGAGVVTTFAGNGTAGASDGAGPVAQFNAPSGLALGVDGSLYVADTRNNRVRRISPVGQVSTVAGSGLAGLDDGPVVDAKFRGLTDLVIDPQGCLYIADTDNASIRRIR